MNHTIITNNRLVAEKYNNILWTDGPVEKTLIKVRDYVYQGYELISHPLAASLRMMFSPYRSVIIGPKNREINFEHAQIIESSIHKYKKHIALRKIDKTNHQDYKLIDLLLLEAALSEIQGKWQ